MALNSRENIALRIAELGEGALKDLLTDMNDSSWQWSRKKEDSSSRNRKIIIGGQVVDSSQAASSASGGNQGSGSQGSGNQLPGGSSASLDQVQSDWKESNSSSKAFIKNKPTLGSISSYDFSGKEGGVYFDGEKFITIDGKQTSIDKMVKAWFICLDSDVNPPLMDASYLTDTDKGVMVEFGILS